MTHTVEELRTALFETMRDLRSDKISLEKAKGVADVAQTIINSAKVEVDMIKAVGTKRLRPTGFVGELIEHDPGRPAIQGTATQPVPGRGLPPVGPRGSL
ncbi:hypothetical protein [Marilutibacter aestuarii]|uniref:hypothetical protein n=1 Tax=Marilutibacter aestuarii TaxID=1706195 RepID=UPI001B87D0CD|nr:hypothetical protein [Lysobacter aestuarii]